MKKFMDENFLLSNETAVDLFHNYAKEMPIIDYHCHISPKEIYENKKFKNITEAWLYGDHYKWRAMRAYGVEEKYITGDASDYDKFMAWARTIPMAVGNPLYHWTHLELQRFFGIYDVLNEKTAPAIWEKVNALLAQDDFRVMGLIKKSNVKLICTTDDPVDTLEYHAKLKEDKDFPVAVLPAMRPDKALGIDKDGFAQYVESLAQAAGKTINNYQEFLAAIDDRARFFHSAGCRVSDHALDYIPFMEAAEEEVNQIFTRALKGEKVSFDDEQKFRTKTLKFLGKIYAELGWTMQFHINSYRNNNTRLFNKLGPDVGNDSLNDSNIAYQLRGLLNALELENALPKTILYTLNPKDQYVLATIMGSFQGEGIRGKMQLGAAWWFLDTKSGMIEQMQVLSNVGLLSNFVGMLTDSRSFLSYTRHEYFRRILCNLLGEWVENGEVPNDIELLGSIVQNISFNNAKNYFGMEFK